MAIFSCKIKEKIKYGVTVQTIPHAKLYPLLNSMPQHSKNYCIVNVVLLHTNTTDLFIFCDKTTGIYLF